MIPPPAGAPNMIKVTFWLLYKMMKNERVDEQRERERERERGGGEL